MSLTVELIYFFLVKFMLINLYYVLNIFLGYKNNGYHFMYHIYAKEYKLYNMLLEKISLEIKSLVSDHSEKN